MIDKDNLDVFALQGLKNAIELCKDHEFGSDFMEPYPWQSEALEGFPELIPESIGLSTIEQRLEDGSYMLAKGLEPALFWEDVEKIWDDTQLVFDAYYEYESDFMLLEKSRVLRALMQDLEEDFWSNLDRYEATIETMVRKSKMERTSRQLGASDTERAENAGAYVETVTGWFGGLIQGMTRADVSDDDTLGTKFPGELKKKKLDIPERVEKKEWRKTAEKYASAPRNMKTLRDQILSEVGRMYGPSARMTVGEQLNVIDEDTKEIFADLKKVVNEERAQRSLMSEYGIVPIEVIRNITLDSEVPKATRLQLGRRKKDKSSSCQDRRLHAQALSAGRSLSKSQNSSRLSSMERRLSELTSLTAKMTVSTPDSEGEEDILLLEPPPPEKKKEMAKESAQTGWAAIRTLSKYFAPDDEEEEG